MPLKLQSSAGGSVTLDVPTTTSTSTLTFPANTGNVVVVDGSGTIYGGLSTTPTGTIINYANTTAPSGYLACDGNVYSRSSYGALANVIGSPPMLSSFTAEYSNGSVNWSGGGQFTVVAGIPFNSIICSTGGVAFVSNTNYLSTTNQFAGGLWTSTDGTTWTPRTSSPFDGVSLLYNMNQNVRNGAIAANVGSTYLLMRSGTNFTGTAAQNFLMSSTDLATWTNRSTTIAATVTGGYNKYSVAGIAGGGLLSRFVMLISHVRQFCCCSAFYDSRPNTATSSDGVTWDFTNSLFPISQNNSGYKIDSGAINPTIAATTGGFIVTHGNTAFFSANGQGWSDISANLRTALGFSAAANVSNSQLFYSVYSANNQFIIPTKGYKFLVSTSANGANGNWATVQVESTLFPQYYTDNDSNWRGLWTANDYYGPSFAWNGDCYALYLYGNGGGNLVYSRDLKYWFKKNDQNYDISGDTAYPGMGGGTTQGTWSRAAAFRLVSLNNGKFLMSLPYAKTIVSFTSTGGYTTATQFPSPKITNQAQYFTPTYNTTGVVSVPYIKT